MFVATVVNNNSLADHFVARITTVINEFSSFFGSSVVANANLREVGNYVIIFNGGSFRDWALHVCLFDWPKSFAQEEAVLVY